MNPGLVAFSLAAGEVAESRESGALSLESMAKRRGTSKSRLRAFDRANLWQSGAKSLMILEWVNI